MCFREAVEAKDGGERVGQGRGGEGVGREGGEGGGRKASM